MIPLLLYAQLLDLATFIFAAAALGDDGEINLLVHEIGIPGTLIVKVLLIIVGALFVAYESSKPAEGKHQWIAGVLLGFGITFGTFGSLSNVASLAVSV